MTSMVKMPTELYLDVRLGLEAFIKARDDLFCDPTLENAKKFLGEPPEGWLDPTVPLASLHKARLQWLHVTDAMIEESMAWLEGHGYKLEFRTIPPLTPESRDAERVIHGWPPLKGK